jgi:hypothetical protein
MTREFHRHMRGDLSGHCPALAPLGIVDIDMPATSERVWRAMANCGKSYPAL